MKVFQKRWVKVLLLLAFGGMLIASIYLDVAMLWSKETKLYEQEPVSYRESVIFKDIVVWWDKEVLQALCEAEETRQAIQNKTIGLTDFTFAEDGETLVPSEELHMTWEEYLKGQGIDAMELNGSNNKKWSEAIVSEWIDVSNTSDFVCISSEDYIKLLDRCPYEKLYDEAAGVVLTQELEEEDGYYYREDYYGEEYYGTDEVEAYESFVQQRLDMLLGECAKFSWDYWEEYWEDREYLRLYEFGDDFIIYNEKDGTIIGTQMEQFRLSEIEESEYVFFPGLSVPKEGNAESWLSKITNCFTTSLVQQLRYELYETADDWNDYFDTPLVAAEIYKDGTPFLSFGEHGEEDTCIKLAEKEEIAYIFGKSSNIYRDSYEIRLYYNEYYLNTAEQKVWEFMYTDCMKHGNRSALASGLTIGTVVLGILLFISFIPPLWKREEQKLRDRVLVEVNIMFTVLAIMVCVCGIYGIVYLGYELFIPLFETEKVLLAGAIIIELLVLLGISVLYQFTSTIIYRLRKRCFMRGWLAGRFICWIYAKAKVVVKNSDILKRRILCLVGIWVCSFIAMLVLCVCAGRNYGFIGVFGMFCYILFMIGFSYVFLKDAMDNKRLLDGCNRMKGGVFEKKIPTNNLYLDKLELAEAINTMGEGLEKAVQTSMKDERMKTELITNVSHDIKTPLTSIINYVDLLKREGVTPEEQQEYLRVLDVKSQRLKQLIEDLVEVSKASTGNIELQLANLDVKELLNQVLGEFQEKFAERNLELIVACAEHKIQIWADGRRCYRILENLFQNVYKYAMPNTRVYVDLQQEANQMVFIVKNISEAPLNVPVEELMERFVRGDVSRSTSGSGLGLSITENLVQLQQGKMEVKLDGDLFKVEIRFPVLE